jgi:hypothetical protein
MVDKFKESHFKLSVAAHMQYDEDLQFNENNVTLYLSELEEYVSSFITFLAQREKNPDAPISALSLDTMANKEFEKGPINIEAPNSTDYNNIDETATEEDEIVTNAKDLYRRFEDLASKGYVDAKANKTK